MINLSFTTLLSLSACFLLKGRISDLCFILVVFPPAELGVGLMFSTLYGKKGQLEVKVDVKYLNEA